MLGFFWLVFWGVGLRVLGAFFRGGDVVDLCVIFLVSFSTLDFDFLSAFSLIRLSSDFLFLEVERVLLMAFRVAELCFFLSNFLSLLTLLLELLGLLLLEIKDSFFRETRDDSFDASRRFEDTLTLKLLPFFPKGEAKAYFADLLILEILASFPYLSSPLFLTAMALELMLIRLFEMLRREPFLSLISDLIRSLL